MICNRTNFRNTNRNIKKQRKKRENPISENKEKENNHRHI